MAMDPVAQGAQGILKSEILLWNNYTSHRHKNATLYCRIRTFTILFLFIHLFYNVLPSSGLQLEPEEVICAQLVPCILFVVQLCVRPTIRVSYVICYPSGPKGLHHVVSTGRCIPAVGVNSRRMGMN